MAIFLPRMSRISASVLSKTFSPSKRISPLTTFPGGIGISRIIDRAVTVLPDPDSPTSPKVWPRSTLKETPSTAVKVPRFR